MFTFYKARWARWEKNHATKVTKIPKTKRRKYGMNETKMGTIIVHILTFHAKISQIDIVCRLIEECGQNFDQKSKSGCLKTFINK